MNRKIFNGMIKSKYIAATAGALMLLSAALPASATTLTSAQVSAIVTLLQTFGADASVVANVQANLTGTVSAPTRSSCVDIGANLIIGSAGHEVVKLQNFLIAEGYLASSYNIGYYGSLTADAVMRWQKAHGMDYVTLSSGVGPTTRLKMACQTNSGPAGLISSISPPSGPIGTVVEVLGTGLSGFEGDLSLTFLGTKGSTTVLTDVGSYAITQDKLIRVTVKDPCKKGEMWMNPRSASGLYEICTYDPLMPGVYKVYANGWNQSNWIPFTITP